MAETRLVPMLLRGNGNVLSLVKVDDEKDMWDGISFAYEGLVYFQLDKAFGLV